MEISRYLDFFEKSYKDNLEHSKFVKKDFPRWSIISGYYAMHDITKLLISNMYGIKIEYEVHATTIKVLRELLKDKDALELLEEGYNEFIYLANDLAEAKKERVKTQYYTGSKFSHEIFQRKAELFLENKVEVYIVKIKDILSRGDIE